MRGLHAGDIFGRFGGEACFAIVDTGAGGIVMRTTVTGVADWLGPLLDRSPDGILLVDSGGRVRSWNPAMLRVSALPVDVIATATIDIIEAGLTRIAHDFNNTLTVIVGFAEQLQIEIGEHQSLNQLIRAATRAADLTKQLLPFSRQQGLRPRVVDVASVVEAMGGMVDRLIGDEVRLGIDAPAGLPSICAGPSQLEQIVLNLARKVRDAMPHGGRLSIRVRSLNVETPEPGRALQPLGGFIWVESDIGDGTTVTIALPVTALPKDATVAHELFTGGFSQRAGGRILVVEDLEPVRTVTRHMLESAGYEVVAVSSPSEALSVMDAVGDRIDLLLSDVMMPEMTGGDLACVLRAVRPTLPVLFMSGLPKPLEWNEPGAFLAKPFTRAMLLSHVRSRLAAKAASAA